MKHIVRFVLSVVALAALSSPATAAECPRFLNFGKYTKCVVVIRGPLKVRVVKSDTARVRCTISVGKSFRAERGAGTADGTRWYGVAFSRTDIGYFSEWVSGSDHRMTIRACQ